MMTITKPVSMYDTVGGTIIGYRHDCCDWVMVKLLDGRIVKIQPCNEDELEATTEVNL